MNRSTRSGVFAMEAVLARARLRQSLRICQQPLFPLESRALHTPTHPVLESQNRAHLVPEDLLAEIQMVFLQKLLVVRAASSACVWISQDGEPRRWIDDGRYFPCFCTDWVRQLAGNRRRSTPMTAHDSCSVGTYLAAPLWRYW